MSYRQFDTSTWKDGWVENLKPLQKYLFIYLWTNDSCNQCGIYEITVNYIAFQTGLTAKQVTEMLPELSPKVFWDKENNILWVKSFFRKQCQNPSFSKSALELVQNEYPQYLVQFIEENKEIFARFDTVLPPWYHRVDTVVPPSAPEQNSTEQNKDIHADLPIGECESSQKQKQPKKPPIPQWQVDELYKLYPKHQGQKDAKDKIRDALKTIPFEELREYVVEYAESLMVKTMSDQYIPWPQKWFGKRYWEGDRESWKKPDQSGGNGNVRGSPSPQETLFAEERNRQRLFGEATKWQREGKTERQILANVFNDREPDFEEWKKTYDRT